MVVRPLLPGTTLGGRYVLSELLGEGAMGSVYRARDVELAREVALKVVRERSQDAPDDAKRARERLFYEARAAAALEHPNAVRIYDVGESDGVAFIAMELVDGRTLRPLIGERRVAMATRCAWLADVARVLAAAHARGLVHRDVKPENVMLDASGTIKVVDFGIARSASLSDAPDGANAGEQDHLLTGTPLYMAPEQLTGERIEAGADQFSWGVMAFELLAGVPPWSSEASVLTIVSQILSMPPPSLRELAPQVPAELASVIARAMNKNPHQRFPSMAELLHAWEAAADRAGFESGAGNPAPDQVILTNIAYELRGDLAITVHNDKTPTDDEHLATLHIMRRVTAGSVQRTLTITRGGAPTPLQRKSYNEALGGRELLAAIVSDEPAVREVVAMLAWHNSKIRPFAREQLDEALAFLGLPSEDWPAIVERVRFYEAELARRRAPTG